MKNKNESNKEKSSVCKNIDLCSTDKYYYNKYYNEERNNTDKYRYSKRSRSRSRSKSKYKSRAISRSRSKSKSRVKYKENNSSHDKYRSRSNVPEKKEKREKRKYKDYESEYRRHEYQKVKLKESCNKEITNDENDKNDKNNRNDKNHEIKDKKKIEKQQDEEKYEINIKDPTYTDNNSYKIVRNRDIRVFDKTDEIISNEKIGNKRLSINNKIIKKETPKMHFQMDLSLMKSNVLNALIEARTTVHGIKQSTNYVGIKLEKQNNTNRDYLKDTEIKENKDFIENNNKLDDLCKNTNEDTMKLSQSISSNESDNKEINEIINNVSKLEACSNEIFSSLADFDMFSTEALEDAVKKRVILKKPVLDKLFHNKLNKANEPVTNCDDNEGYYRAIIGEILNEKYQVMGEIGKGVFSTVLKCKQLFTDQKNAHDAALSNHITNNIKEITTYKTVAVKLVRNNDVMRKSAQNEIKLLQELGSELYSNRKHCVKLLDNFEHCNHIALVFEPLQMDAREMIRKFGSKKGIALKAVRAFTRQLLIALNHLNNHRIVHADLKPDNILLSENQKYLKICDFGSAFKIGNGGIDLTPYLVSRYYRAPEIILGLPYDTSVDIWSLGCCLYEMFTGKVMFPGDTNNAMIRLCLELKGTISSKIIKKHRSTYIEKFEIEPHFDEQNRFLSKEIDIVSGKPMIRTINVTKPSRDLANELISAKAVTDDKKTVMEFKDLLEKMFVIDPNKRISIYDALKHPFVRGHINN